jgi:N-acetyl-alpha-D-glucosaminyl L-malate synthase BshA
VETFSIVSKEIPSRPLFVGEGPELSKVLCRVKELGLLEKVTFCGKQDDVAQLISLADVMLLPSEKESFGLVALEAMACGVPTIASNAGGIPELITHGETGFLADIGDVERMAAYVKLLLSDAKLYETMKKACLHRARTVFCNELITAQYEEIYYRVLDREMPEDLKRDKLSCI